MIKERITISWFCTDCNEEYQNKKSIGVCKNHPDRKMCEECWWKCDGSPYHSGKETTGEGCHEIFCIDCIKTSPWNIPYPIYYCQDCLDRIGIDPFNYSWETEDESLVILHGKNIKDPNIVYYPLTKQMFKN